MSLTVAYNLARDALNSGALASSVVSRNIANADNPNAARKITQIVSDAGGFIQKTTIAGAVNGALLERALLTTSSRNSLEASTGYLERLSSIVGDPESASSPAALIGKLRNALQVSATSPQDELALRQVLGASNALASSLRGAANLVAGVRTEVAGEIKTGAQDLKDLLQQFESVNTSIIKGTLQGDDTSDLVDKRNSVLRDISTLVDVRPVVRGNNDMMLFLASGVTLFETVPREVSFDSSSALGWGQSGEPIRIDGVPLTAASNLGGKLGALLNTRDNVSVKVGQQLDEIARGLIAATAEADQSGGGQPDLAGLFTYSGGPGLPPAGTLSNELALKIEVNPNVDPALGGSLYRLRDGAISDPGSTDYVYNQDGVDGYSARLFGLIDKLSATQPFDPASGLTAADLGAMSYATASAGWLEEQRSTASNELEDKRVLNEHAVGAWQNSVGINVDTEISNLIALQRSYQASSRLISTVDQMFASLLQAVS